MQKTIHVDGVKVKIVVKAKTSMGNACGFNIDIFEDGRDKWHRFKMVLTAQEAFDRAFDIWSAERNAQKGATDLVDKATPVLDGTVYKFTVFYQKNFGDHMADLYGDEDTIEKPYWRRSFQELADVHTNNKEQVFRIMQGDVWSPEGEARGIIRGLKLQHTSMSMGDLIRDEDGQWWICAMAGFKKCTVV